MKDIKAADLYNKWRPLLPPECRDITCPHPGDEVLQKVANERKSKAAARAAKATNETEKGAKKGAKRIKTATKKA